MKEARLKQRKRVLHISKEADLEDALTKQGFVYDHFNYLPFYEEDNLLGMWRRVFLICLGYKPHLILLQFEHEDCVNDNEIAELRRFGIPLLVYGKNCPS